jgi:hypothetical protein
LEITEVAHIFGLLFPMDKVMYIYILTKMYLATFWAIFSQAHLVTLNLTSDTRVSRTGKMPVKRPGGVA